MMPTAPASLSRPAVVDVLKKKETALDAQIRGLKKVKSVCSSGRRKIEKQPSSRKVLEKLLADFEKLPAEASDAAGSVLSDVVPSLRQSIHDLSANFEQTLRHGLQQNATESGLHFGAIAGKLALGPFALNLDYARECASLVYGTAPVAERLPLEAEKIIAACEQQMQSVLLPPDSLTGLAEELEQAIRVAVVRTGKKSSEAELRAELPAVYREMAYVRQPQNRPLTKSSVREYSLARFIVEIKTLIQSDQNLSGAKRFRLETAVIDNTRNKKKSIYIPNDLNKGYGEGMYYQALVLQIQE